ncbi:MAG TPA: hypothetical protein PL017_06535 [Tenuifilaceae bacterium]|mgnify:CR=1 FL=1|nr:hypothetical protein [Tenuifilaceae bacterium]HPE19190.1 hypothetical protein [Tenuifilaceae bacterium]HPJ45737.1 hypothetical protein [Tenuifilaceae bacterium]HPQ33702.1 hypothetical protein [Tenuifilaceae bacterium]HRX68876.1 hypothetical protein [Tenuifilaceae bacterium]
MSKIEYTEKYGGLTKEEPLTCVNNEILLKNTCVLESVSPYFGYYNEVPQANKPHFIYLLIEGNIFLEQLVRANQTIQGEINFTLDSVPGSVTFKTQTSQAIRIFNLKNYSQIARLQELYIEKGITLKAKSRSINNEMALIKLRRFFKLVEVSVGLYTEYRQPNIGYFEIPKSIAWEEFKLLTAKVKYNTSLLYFDAAQAFIYNDGKIVELVRIYRENLTPDKLTSIREKYLKLLA